jgi:hypothetical protein
MFCIFAKDLTPTLSLKKGEGGNVNMSRPEKKFFDILTIPLMPNGEKTE